jgi:uncharacterized protein
LENLEWNSIIYPLLGGGLIGVAATVMLLFNGRVTGISGIIAATISRPSREGLWRWLFLAGMIMGGTLMQIIQPNLLVNLSDRSTGLVLVAGLLVGYGTVMGSGCTSGHGVCGISRFSVRSALATVIFMLFGFLAVQFAQYFLGATT